MRQGRAATVEAPYRQAVELLEADGLGYGAVNHSTVRWLCRNAAPRIDPAEDLVFEHAEVLEVLHKKSSPPRLRARRWQTSTWLTVLASTEQEATPGCSWQNSKKAKGYLAMLGDCCSFPGNPHTLCPF
eukprot:c9255_g1_i1.p2 GENE.c9255_g1_i1~~c9255_g1_i1.p2  ORF type:complete len:129 (-),score=11.44 c9255_g1_i1:281-667(-)